MRGAIFCQLQRAVERINDKMCLISHNIFKLKYFDTLNIISHRRPDQRYKKLNIEKNELI